MKTNVLFILIVVVVHFIQLRLCLVFESLGIGLAASAIYIGYCKFQECCTDEYLPRDTLRLKNDLNTKLYGQHIAKDIIYSAIFIHVHHNSPRKPLVLSFHGLPGSGKNYVVTMIANALFKNGEKSSYYHFFNGRSDFPSDNEVDLYKITLKNKVEKALSKCDRSVFVFDEVDKMPSGVLDVLVPFLDYSSWNNKGKSIFIFLSNTGSTLIVKRMLELWQSGKSRDDLILQDFETLIQIGAFNEKGGLQKSGTIESKLIDHHVPFLPMEQKQVIQCIKDVFKFWNYNNPSKSMIDEVLSHVTYGPPPHNLYSNAGCKKLDHKVSSIIYKHKFE